MGEPSCNGCWGKRCFTHEDFHRQTIHVQKTHLHRSTRQRPAEARRNSQRLVDEVTVHCDILGRLTQTYSGETMAHEAKVRSYLARMQHSPTHIRRRIESGSPPPAMTAASSAPGENTTTTVIRENETAVSGSDHEEVGGEGGTVGRIQEAYSLTRYPVQKGKNMKAMGQ